MPPACPVPHAPRISVVIPLEFNRGQEIECLTRWISGQDFPRAQYEVVVVGCRASVTAGQVAQFEKLLKPHARLVWHAKPHDIALCDHGVRQALGKWVFITESHVLPEADTLARIAHTIESRPDLAAFSGMSRRLTHNPLSEAEADMYEPHIRSNLESHPWRKVLDQCYATRRDVFLQAGGFPPEYGHFAEWVLAARMKALGHEIAFVSEVRVHHHYVGDIHELEVFAADFARGEARYMAEAADEPCRQLLVSVGAESQRFASHPELKAHARKLRLRAAWAGRSWMDLCKGFGRALRDPALAQARRHRLQTAGRLRSALAKPDADGQRLAALVAWNDAVARESRLKFLHTAPAPAWPPVRPGAGVWHPTTPATHAACGLHDLERHGGRAFRWTEPVFHLRIGPGAGRWQVTAECLPVRDFGGILASANGRPVAVAVAVEASGIQLRLTVEVPEPGSVVISLWVPEAPAPGDLRALGLPVAGVTWTRAT